MMLTDNKKIVVGGGGEREGVCRAQHWHDVVSLRPQLSPY